MAVSERLKDHVSYFDQILDLIPPQHYLPRDPDEDDWKSRKRRFAKNVNNKAPEQERKEKAKKAKREKLDPENQVSIPVLQKKAVENQPSFKFQTASLPVEELRKRLQDRIAELRKKRGQGVAPNPPPKPNPITKSPDLNGNKPQPRSHFTSAPRSRSAYVKHSLAPRDPSDEEEDLQAGRNSPASDSDAASGSSRAESENAESEDDELSLKYGTFDFSGGQAVPSYLLSGKKKKKNLKSLLKRAEAEQAEMEAMPDSEEARNLKAERSWQSALQRAQGAKLKDDPKKLKQSIKRRQKQKEKSAMEWKERVKNLNKDKQDRISQREDNIASAKQQRKDKKMGIKTRPGFEGAKRGYLNK